mmetsp:Transcript_18199/g.37369  ORF Transcript_18199/g.37369 Transcript_18199/m.37369 type:complete len:542 (+) Transcript_18199:18-1643(+)
MGNQESREVFSTPPPSPPASSTQLFFEAVTALDAKAALILAPSAYGEWWISLVHDDPWHVVVETMLLVFILYLVFLKKQKKVRSELTEADVEDLIAEWKPAPLVPALTEKDLRVLANDLVVAGCPSPDELVVVGGPKEHATKINLITNDFLGLSGRKELKASAELTLNEYGCGSCGPRGFYGSVMPHLEVEAAVATFVGTEAAIAYSDTASAQASTVPSFAKRGDLVVADAAVHEALKVGVELSRAKVIYFRHNDAADLKRILTKVASEDRRLSRDVTKQRRFIVTEALFKVDGSVAPLKEIVDLKKAHGFRLVLDECLSFGVLGATGRGLTEECSLPVTDVDAVLVTLENAMGSIGGLCCGSIEVCDHQRLSGAGYCFSAAAPPFVSSVGVAALALLEKEPHLVKTLREKTANLRTFVSVNCTPWLDLSSDPLSPVVHLKLTPAVVAKLLKASSSPADSSYDVQLEALTAVKAHCLKLGDCAVGLSRRARGEAAPGGEGEGGWAADSFPTLKLACKASMSDALLREAANSLKKACGASLP